MVRITPTHKNIIVAGIPKIALAVQKKFSRLIIIPSFDLSVAKLIKIDVIR